MELPKYFYFRVRPKNKGTEIELEDASDADVVEVVRCKDCRFSHMTYSGECKSCDKWVDDDDFHLTLYLDGNFYCAFGERKEDEID